jgi:hypothetical protein
MKSKITNIVVDRFVSDFEFIGVIYSLLENGQECATANTIHKVDEEVVRFFENQAKALRQVIQSDVEDVYQKQRKRTLLINHRATKATGEIIALRSAIEKHEKDSDDKKNFYLIDDFLQFLDQLINEETKAFQALKNKEAKR